MMNQGMSREVGCLNTAQKLKLSIKDFFRKCDQIRSFLMKEVS